MTRNTRALLGGARQPRARRRALDGVAVTPAPESPTPDAGVSAGRADAWKPVVGAPAATLTGTTPQKTAQHHKKKGGARPLPRSPSHYSREPGRSQIPRDGDPHMRGEDAGRSLPNVLGVGPSPHAWGADLRSGPDHPHVRGADVPEPNGAALQRTTRYRAFPQFWGYGAQVTLVDVERAALMSAPSCSMPRRYRSPGDDAAEESPSPTVPTQPHTGPWG